jgi:hypothetical protein
MRWPIVSLGLLLVVSLTGKLLSQPVDATVSRDATEHEVTDALMARGFAPDGVEAVSVDGFYRALVFAHPACGALRAMAVPLNGEGSEIVRQVATTSERIAYVYDAALLSDVPVMRATVRESAIRLAHAIGWSPRNGRVSLATLIGDELCLARAAAPAEPE